MARDLDPMCALLSGNSSSRGHRSHACTHISSAPACTHARPHARPPARTHAGQLCSAFHNCRQQEQAILGLLISAGAFPDSPDFLAHARAAQAFYNAFFLDMDEQARQPGVVPAVLHLVL